ncbi:MAG: TonB-dependent receptor [Haliscomenobacter sp.]|nr:TonB-dependent receptor [Haliscomenobacter sp.]
MEYRAITARGFWQIKTGYFDEHLQYVDDQILLDSRSHFRTYLAEITGQWRGGNRHTFLLGNTHVHTQAWSEGYRDQIPTEYKTALFASWKYRGGKLNAQGSLRQEIVGGTPAPIVPALGVDYQIHPNLLVKGSASRNYRLPTLNDRFWAPGGNPDLLPESGWSQELGFHYRKQKMASSSRPRSRPSTGPSATGFCGASGKGKPIGRRIISPRCGAAGWNPAFPSSIP